MRAVAEFMRKSVSQLEQPDVYLRTSYLQIEIDIALRQAIDCSNQLKAARTERHADAVLELNQKLQIHARQIMQMCACVAAEFSKPTTNGVDHHATPSPER